MSFKHANPTPANMPYGVGRVAILNKIAEDLRLIRSASPREGGASEARRIARANAGLPTASAHCGVARQRRCRGRTQFKVARDGENGCANDDEREWLEGGRSL